MNEELDRIKKLAGMTPKEEVTEKVELTASDDHAHKDAKASDVSQAMNMARLKKTVEDRDDDDTDFTGLFTGVARGEISLDDKGKISESSFGIIKELNEAVGIIRQKKVDEEGRPNFQKGGKIFGKDGAPDEDIDGPFAPGTEPNSKKKKPAPDMSPYADANKKKSVAEEGSDEKKAGRRAAGSYNRPGSKEQKRAASKSARKQGKAKSKEQVDERMSPEDARKKADQMQAMADRIAQEGGQVGHKFHAEKDMYYQMAGVREDMVDDMMGHGDHMSAPTTSCPHCGSPDSYDMESDTCAACGYGNEPDMDSDYGHVFEKDSLSRIMVELIFEEMKKGKNAKEISEELSFAYEGVQKIVEVLKKKVSEGYTILPPIDRERYTDLSAEGLEGPIPTKSGKVLYYDPKEGKYYDRDSDMYISYEEYEAYNTKRPDPVKETGFSRAQSDYDHADPYAGEPSESDIARAHELGEAVAMDYLDLLYEYDRRSNKPDHFEPTINKSYLAKSGHLAAASANFADYQDSRTHPEDMDAIRADLISDISGTIIKALEEDGIMVLSDEEVHDVSMLSLKKYLMLAQSS